MIFEVQKLVFLLVRLLMSLKTIGTEHKTGLMVMDYSVVVELFSPTESHIRLILTGPVIL